ncbi:hypothetical protein QYE76_019431 [Lolium multiflorum]|uniref:Transposase (putative) gypsy type domain-containing protein n=1 Tax=Lolium multiflorum TaxID=4521 RepID=A0AAD8R5Q7_LOLMU|nr:hypothetical protein QYE76_019431 [Lolium multiflorum]
MAQPSGSWEGSTTTMEKLQRLHRTHRIPPGVEVRVPGEEIVPDAQPGEYVVFTAHFERGFGLPASPFFRAFLEFFGLQPHHLLANAFVTLLCFVAFCEGYTGLWPDVDFWSRMFFIKAQTTEGQLRPCGVTSFYPCPGSPFPKIPTVDSVKKWQTTFFYVKNEKPTSDRLNLPPFSLAAPTRLNWGFCHRPIEPEAEVTLLLDFVLSCVTNDGLTAADLLCAFTSRRVLPLQWRSHKICHMSGRFDPTRTSKVELYKEGMASRVNYISNTRLCVDWEWGMEPFSRLALPALNFPRQSVEDGDLADKVWESDHADLADLQAGNDQNPEPAAHQAVEDQGEPSSPPQPEEGEVPTAEPIRAVPLAVVPPAADAGQPSKVRKRTTAQLEAALKKQRRLQKPVPEAAGAAIKFKGAGAGSTSGAVSPPPVLPREKREPTPQPPAKDRARTPHVIPPPSVGVGTSSSAPPVASSGSGSRTSQPTIGDLLQRRHPEAPPIGASRTAPGARAGSGPRVTLPPLEPPVASDPAGQAVPPPSSGPAREEPARSSSADARALVKAKGPAVEESPQPLVSLHVARGAALAHVVSAFDSSLGSVGTMDKEWRDADNHEVTSREGKPGVASMEMFFSDMRAYITGSTSEADGRLRRVEKVNKTITDKRAELYNRLVTSYHKAKTDRAGMAQELESAKAAAAQVPQLQEELRLAREAAQATEGELGRLRRLEANHVAELDSVRKIEQEKVDSLNRRLGEVDEQCQKLRTAFPETQAGALAAMGVAQDAGRAAGEESSDHFSIEDHLVAMHARITPMTMLGHELRQAAEDLFQMLWPTETPPSELADLVKRLRDGPDRLLDWKDSAARAGADIALSFVLSWYEEVDLDQLETRRADVEGNLSEEAKARRLARASAIADFADKSVFITDPDAPEEVQGEDEEMADAEEADPAADSQAPPAGPAPAGV